MSRRRQERTGLGIAAAILLCAVIGVAVSGYIVVTAADRHAWAPFTFGVVAVVGMTYIAGVAVWLTLSHWKELRR